MPTSQLHKTQAVTDEKFVLISDLNCPFCFVMHERVIALGLEDKVCWNLIEHAPAFNSEAMTEQQAAQLDQEYKLIRQRAEEVEVKKPLFCTNTRLAILYYIHVERIDPEKAQHFLRLIFQAYWLQGLDISHQQVIYELLIQSGFDGIKLNEEDRRQLQENQRLWQESRFEARIPAILSPDQQLMLGLQHSETINSFIECNQLAELDTGQSCVFNGQYKLAFITAEHFMSAIDRYATDYDCHAYSSIQDLLEDHNRIAFDAIILCFQNDKKTDFSLIRYLKNKNLIENYLPLLYISAQYASEDENQAFLLGADDFMRLDSGIETICSRIKKSLINTRMVRVLHQNAAVDGLTGVVNKRTFLTALHTEWRNACRNQLNLSLIMIDIDYFKNFNDSLGHCAGDIVLKKVADALALNLYRAKDTLARFGGEEFVILLPETNQQGLEFVCQQLCRNVEDQKIHHPHSAISDYVTISIGGCHARPHPDQSALQLLELADTALYQAKNNGRNQYRLITMAEMSYE